MGDKNGAVADTEIRQQDETVVIGYNAQNAEFHARLVRITRYLAVLEIHDPALVLQTSEVLTDLRIMDRGHTIYSGRGVISNLVSAGVTNTCEVSLEEKSWMDVEFTSEMIKDKTLNIRFKTFLHDWQKLYKIFPDFKLTIVDMQSFLAELRLWLDQLELNIRSSPSVDRVQLERDVSYELSKTIVPIISDLFDRFEIASRQVDNELLPAHRSFGKQHLHPLLLSSPFVYRTFSKPLGYAGDYEMVNMMFRDPCEGGSLFAKLINLYALQLPPIKAHRNRIEHLRKQMIQETARVRREGRRARIFSLGCGPAQEVQQFLCESLVCDESEFVLVDFNDETIAHTTGVLAEIKQRLGHRTNFQFQKKSAQYFLKQADRHVQRLESEKFDLIYCAGLFDYIPDKVCRKLMDVFYDMLASGGLLIATNVDVHTHQNEMEFFLEWHLIHRNSEQVAALAPMQALPENISLVRDFTGVNIVIEIRKPDCA